MTEREFANFCQEVTAYYGRDGTLNPKRLDLWYEACRHVPAVALGWIQEQVFAERDTLPPNLPKVIREGWDAWKSANPTRLVREDIDCTARGCEEGWIRVVDDDGYRSVAYCDQCAVTRRICKPGNKHLSNLVDLEAKGYRWFSPEMQGQRIEYLRRAANGLP